MITLVSKIIPIHRSLKGMVVAKSPTGDRAQTAALFPELRNLLEDLRKLLKRSAEDHLDNYRSFYDTFLGPVYEIQRGYSFRNLS